MNLHERVALRYRLLLSMSMDEAKQLLGFPPTASPSDSEVNRALRQKALEHHPDRGGDPAKMVALNSAADILKGKGKATPDYGGGGGGYYQGPPPPRGDWGPPPPKQPEETVTFEEAKNKASIPGGVEWLFVTEPHYSGYSSDEYARQAHGWVAVGQTEKSWVFVRAENWFSDSYVFGDPSGKKDIWTLDSMTLPKKDKVTAAELVGGVKRAWKGFKHLKKNFNFKVVPAEGWQLRSKLPQGRSLSIKNWLLNAGLMQEEDLASPRKYTIDVHYEKVPFGSDKEHPPPGFFKDRWGDPYKLTLIINGKEYDLSEQAMERLSKFRIKGKYFVDWVFGDYYYGGETKSLTKKRDAKEVMKAMAEKLPIADWVKDALAAAAAAPPAGGGGSRRYSYDRTGAP